MLSSKLSEFIHVHMAEIKIQFLKIILSARRSFLIRWRLPIFIESWSDSNVQGWVGWGFEQPGLGKSVPAHGSGVEPRWPLRSLPT